MQTPTVSENEIAKIVVNSAFKIHTTLGPGLFESVYETVMEHELVNEHGLEVKRQVPIPVTWKNVKLELGFRSDLIIENKVILELKAIDKLAPVHFRQLLTYLKLTNLKLGLIINFDEPFILYTDASSFALKAILSQKDDQKREQERQQNTKIALLKDN